ncbi:hypothetical protein Tco_0182474 [Tanacetum coccineum]
MGDSSSQPRTDPALSLINAFPVEELYTPEFSDSLQDNTGYWQAPNPHESPTPWTTEEEIALAKGWLAVSENSKHSNTRRQASFWCEESGADDADYVQRALIHYEIDTDLPFKLRHC